MADDHLAQSSSSTGSKQKPLKEELSQHRNLNSNQDSNSKNQNSNSKHQDSSSKHRNLKSNQDSSSRLPNLPALNLDKKTLNQMAEKDKIKRDQDASKPFVEELPSQKKRRGGARMAENLAEERQRERNAARHDDKRRGSTKRIQQYAAFADF